MAENININSPQKVNITCFKGDRFSITLTVTNDDGTPYSFINYNDAKMEVKTKHGTTALMTFRLGESDANGSIALSSGQVDIVKTEVTLDSDMYFYDLELNLATGAVQTLIYGTLYVKEDITK